MEIDYRLATALARCCALPSRAALGCTAWLLLAGLLASCASTPSAEPPPPPPSAPAEPAPEPPPQGGKKWKAVTE